MAINCRKDIGPELRKIETLSGFKSAIKRYIKTEEESILNFLGMTHMNLGINVDMTHFEHRSIFSIVQALKENTKETSYACLSDFIAPVETGLTDYMGMFVVTCTGAEKLSDR